MRDSQPSEPVMRGLKDFQRCTVNFAYARMFASEAPALRFLVADEVGLGKTLVAKGLIARAIESGDQELCSRMLDTSVAVSRVLETARRDAGIRFPSEF